ncbi:MAG: STAS domain-containing protein [Acidobacteriia bacterium]|nr:STAS domain-containing protein [Terriglobia bacterium]
MELTLQIGRAHNVIVVSCCGRIVFGEETTELCRSVRNLLPENPRVVLNLRAVQYVDSGGLGAVVGLVLSARSLGGDVKICDPSSRVHNLLQITRLMSVVDVLATEEEAVAGFRCSPVAA